MDVVVAEGVARVVACCNFHFPACYGHALLAALCCAERPEPRDDPAVQHTKAKFAEGSLTGGLYYGCRATARC